MMRSPRWSAGALAAAVLSLSAPAQGIPSIEEFTGSMTRLDGFVPLCWDAATGKLFLEVPSFDEELLCAAGRRVPPVRTEARLVP